MAHFLEATKQKDNTYYIRYCCGGHVYTDTVTERVAHLLEIARHAGRAEKAAEIRKALELR